jgi:hypothetical protein
MSTEELDKILGGQDQDPSSDAGDKKPEEKKPDQKDPEVLSKEQELTNINNAIRDAKADLKKIRTEKKEIQGEKPGEEEIPKINLEDPSSKAWDRHIKENVNPLAEELEAEKSERFSFAFKDFVSTHPGLEKSPEKMKAVIATYERLKNNTGRTREGIMNDLRRAYAAENFETIESERHSGRVSQARRDAIYSDAGVSRGASSYHQERETDPEYSNQDAAILARWGMSPQEHAALKKEQDAKKEKE